MTKYFSQRVEFQLRASRRDVSRFQMLMASQVRRLVFSMEEASYLKEQVLEAGGRGEHANSMVNLLLNLLPIFSDTYCARYGFQVPFSFV